MAIDDAERAELEHLRELVRVADLHTFSFDVDTALAGPVEPFVVPADRAAFVAALRAHLVGAIERFECEYRTGEGDGPRWRLARGLASRDISGRPTRVIGTSVDITRLKQAHEELQQAKDRLEAAVTGSKVSTWDIEMVGGDISTARTTYNNLWEPLGYEAPPTATSSLGALVDYVIAPEEREGFRADLQAFLATKEREWERVVHVSHVDGSVRWLLTRGIAVRDTTGTATRFTGTSIDITDLKQAERALVHSEEMVRSTRETYELAMRSSDVTLVVGDFPSPQGGDPGESKWTYFNMWEPLGIDPATVPTDFEQLSRLTIHPDDYASVLAYWGAAAQARTPNWYIEHRVLRADGEVRWRLSRGAILYDEAGNVTRLVSTTIDTTELKRIQDELQRARQAAEAANRAKDEFLANVSHELRTPMNAIFGMTDLALDSSPSEQQRQLLTTVRTAASSLLTILNDLLDFSKIASGKLTLERAAFSLRAAVVDTVQALAVRAQRQGLELTCHVEPDVPDTLEGDVGRLRQALMNLIGNAIKFTPEGEVEVTVETAPADDDAVALVFTVRDTGIGIAPDKQEAIFRAFEQEDASTTRKYGGTGLGLTISAQLASLMNGGIAVHSAPGAGSTFRLTARFARATGLAAPLPRAAPEQPAADPGSPLRVLAAEDNDLNVTLLQKLLAKRGHSAEFARDGHAALALASRGGFDLMLLDLHMPGLDGFDVVKAIRERERATGAHLPILALTARHSARDRERCLEAGMDEFLSKPIEAASLWAMIERVTASRPAAPAARASEPGLLDSHTILRACGGDAGILEPMLAAFRRNLPKLISRVGVAMASGDLKELQAAAHQLIGTVGVFSTVAADVAASLEDAARREDRDGCTALVGQLERLCALLMETTQTLSIEMLSV
jgi:signal transduction histidine kinase/ActR/RegA family two-component response regulator